MSEKRRIVITGQGQLAPKAIGVEAYWDLISKGESGISPISTYHMGNFRLTHGGEVTDFEPRKMVPNRKSLKVMARDIQLVVGAAKLCMDDSKLLEAEIDSTRLGVSMGAGYINTSVQEMRFAVKGSIDEQGKFDIKKYAAEGMKGLTPLWLLKYLPNMLACHISIQYDAQGPSNSLTTGDAASSQAIGEAYRILERGDADMMLVGGADSKLDPLSWSRFEMMGLLTKNGCPPQECIRPFDANSDGFLPGEAATVLMLEELEHAQKRGAPIYGEVVGFAASANGSPIIKKIDSRAQAVAIKAALNDASISPEEIDLIVAHGIGVAETDRLEAEAIQSSFGEKASQVPVTSFKASTGFIGAASGGVGVVTALQSIKNQMIPPTLNHESKKPKCDLNLITGQAKRAEIKTCLVNSFGLTGQNACLVIQKFEA